MLKACISVVLLAGMPLSAAYAQEEPASHFSDAEVQEAIDEGVELFHRGRFGALVVATDPLERFENIVGVPAIQYWSENEMIDVLFNVGDEAFEGELDRIGGAGQGPQRAGGLPAYVQRIHNGERGGYDSASCRSCHFSGGSDGAGTMTQLGLFRGDGQHLASATVRDAPHVMGLGYIARAAREIEAGLFDLRDTLLLNHEFFGGPQSGRLLTSGLDFGVLVVREDGTLDTSGVIGVSPDLKVRPFGHKGRHATLEEVADEAFQVHHGLQSSSRVEYHADRVNEFLGDGPLRDRDGDGVEVEATEGQAVLLAGYMSLLSTPIIRPPESPELIQIWAEGRAIFEAIGCERCHRSDLRIQSYETTIAPTVPRDWSITINLFEHGDDPKPRNLDFGPEDDGIVPSGAPLFAFTDLMRHDMGAELAEPVGEPLPDGSGDVIQGNVWLTRSLWGLADTAPYLHDGRASTIHEAIVLHGGEAEPSSEAYRALSEHEQGALRVFLMSLTREPSLFVE